MTFRTAFTLSALILNAGLAQAQRPATPATPITPATPQTPATPDANNPQDAQTYTPYRAKQVLGTAVSLGEGERVGTVDDIVFDQDGQIEYLIVSENNRLVTVPFGAAKFDLNNKTANLQITADKFRSVPRYDATTYPAFYTPAYRTEAYGYYGLTPRELRRALLPRRR